MELGIADGSSPRETFAPDASTVTAQFKVKHNERFSAVPWFLGYAQLAWSGAPGTTVTRLERLTPKAHRDSATGDEVPGMYATAVPEVAHHKATGKNTTLSGSGEGSRTQFARSKLTVNYEQVPFAVLEDGVVPATEEYRRYVWIKDVQVTTENLTLPAGARRYVDATSSGTGFAALPYGRVVYIPITRHVLAWESLPGALYTVGTTTPTAWHKRVFGWPTQSIKPLIGRVNSHDWLSWPAGTLLLEGVKPIVRRHPTIGLSWTFDVTYAHNPVGWLNSYFNAVGTAPARVGGWYFAASSPYTNYAVADVPDDYGLFPVGRIEKVFDVTG